MKAQLPLTGLPIGLYNLTVLNADGTNDTWLNGFQVMNQIPNPTAISPVAGYNNGDVKVTITGSKFVSGCALYLVNANATIPGSVTSYSSASITGIFPLTGAPAGVYTLNLSNPGGMNGSKLNAFTVKNPGTDATISGINPASGFNNAKLPVTISGSNFRTPTVYLDQGLTLIKGSATAGKKSTDSTLYVTLPLNTVKGGLYNLTLCNSDGGKHNRTGDILCHRSGMDQ